MPSATRIAREVLEELRAVGIPTRAELMAAEYMASNLVHLGCTVPDVRRIARSYARALKDDPARAVDVARADDE